MLTRACSLLCVLALAACGGTSAAPMSSTSPTEGPTCADVAAKIGALIAAEEGPRDDTAELPAGADAPPPDDTTAQDWQTERCRADGWSAEARQCFLALTSAEGLTACSAQLTPEQQAALQGG